jgi:hypothetical protein
MNRNKQKPVQHEGFTDKNFISICDNLAGNWI